MIAIGIDPGKTGAMALISNGRLANVYPFKDVALEDLGNIIYNQRMVNPDIICVERVTSSPQMGVVSSFTFGRCFECVRLASQLTGARLITRQPRKWQEAIGCFSGGDKKKLHARAKELYPYYKFTQASADAVLIAHYAYKWAEHNGR